MSWLLVAGFVLAPMNSLSVLSSSLTLGEVTVLLWVVWAIASGRYKFTIDTNVKFWSLFLWALTSGTVMGWGLEPQNLRPGQLLVWLYLAVASTVIYQTLWVHSPDYLDALMRRLGATYVLVNFPLWALGQMGISHLGKLQILYEGNRFSGGADNPHQTALVSSVALFINIRAAARSESVLKRGVYLSLAAGAVVVGLAAETSTWSFSVVVGGGFAVFVYVATLIRDELTRQLALFGFVTVGLVGGFWLFPRSKQLFINFLDSDPNGWGRLEIYSSIGEVFRSSPLLGLGPGSHGRVGGTAIELHNTYLEFLAAGGALALTSFVIYSVMLVYRMRLDPTLWTVILPMYLYGLAGFSARRLPFWIVLMVASALADSLGRCEAQERENQSGPLSVGTS